MVRFVSTFLVWGLLGLRSSPLWSANPANALLSQEYFVSAAVPLAKEPNGVDGRLVLFQDRCLQGREVLNQRRADECLIYGDGVEGIYKDAWLAVLTADGNILEEKEVHSPWAGLKPEDLEGNRCPVFLADSDLDTGNPYIFGIYTEVLLVQHGKIVPLTAMDSRTGKMDEISLGHARRGYWKLVPSAKGFGKEIWSLWCENYVAENPPQTRYERYVYDGKGWIRYESQVHEFWDSYEDDRPDNSAFLNAGK